MSILSVGYYPEMSVFSLADSASMSPAAQDIPTPRRHLPTAAWGEPQAAANEALSCNATRLPQHD